jgi:hypothetical protein
VSPELLDHLRAIEKLLSGIGGMLFGILLAIILTSGAGSGRISNLLQHIDIVLSELRTIAGQFRGKRPPS